MSEDSMFRTAVAAVALLGAALLACGGSHYEARSIARAGDVDPRAVRTLGCLDVGFALSGGGATVPGQLLSTRFGNRCMHPVAFDLSALRIVAHDPNGAALSYSLVDPRNEVREMHLDANAEGHEKIRIEGPSSSQPAARICLHLDRVAPESPEAKVQPVCFAMTNYGWQVSS